MLDPFRISVGGRFVETPETFEVLDPATEQVLSWAPDCPADLLDEVIEGARTAQRVWHEDESGRRQALRDVSAVLRAHADALSDILTREQGRILADTRGEIDASAWWLEQVAAMEIPRYVPLDDDGGRVEVRRRPHGVVAAITPWNYPILLAVAKVGPALLVGNTVVVKPSEYTPLTTLRIGELLADVLPPGALTVVSGGGSLGARMTTHPGIDMVSFTGSIPTGVAVARAVAPTLRRVSLELGGNDASIVLADADVDRVVDGVFDSVFEDCGQACIGVKRLYVHADLYDDVVDGLVARAERTRVGSGLDPHSEMGPVNNRAQLDRIIELTEDAARHGARILSGGRRLDRSGYFIPPTIVTGVEEGVRLVDEEQFGPVLPVMPFRDVDDAVARANTGPFGLGGSVWTRDRDRAQQVASRLECGTVWINHHKRVHPAVPFGGLKMSGLGTESGTAGLEEFSSPQAVYDRT